MKNVNFLVTVLLSVSFVINASAQDKLVTIKFTNKPFGEALKEIGRRYDLNFSYNNDLSVLDQPVSIDAKDLPIAKFLAEFFAVVGVEYKMIDQHVAINEKTNTERSSPKETVNKDTQVVRISANPNTLNVLRKESVERDTSAELEGNSKALQDTNVNAEPRLDKRKVVNVVSGENLSQKSDPGGSINNNAIGSVALGEPVNDADRKESLTKNMALGFVASVDFYAFSSSDLESSTRSFLVKPNYGLGLWMRKTIADRLTIEMQTRVSTRNFTMKYNYRLLDSVDPLVMERTTFELLYIDFPAKVTHLLLEKGNFDFNIYMGAIASFLIKQKVQTFSRDGNEAKSPASIEEVQPFTFGLIGGFQMRYPIGERGAICLSPTYGYYLTPLNDGAERIDVRMMNLELGMLFNL